MQYSSVARNTMQCAELFSVRRYYPESATCDLIPSSTLQRGELSQVPIALTFCGAWETQSQHNPVVGGTADTTLWGNAPRGARWGQAYPIEPGDQCIVQYLNGSPADPVITAFITRQSYSVPWTATQVLSKGNDYTNETADDDDLLEGRYDLLLPSGAWLRSTLKGSWVMATAPVDRPKAFLTLREDGQIRIKARGADDYAVHLDFDPSKQIGRIALGPLEDSSLIEFENGNITIRAKNELKIFAQAVQGDVRPSANGSAFDALTSAVSEAIAPNELTDLVNRAAGETVLQSVATAVTGSPGVVVLTTEPVDQPALKVLQELDLTDRLFGSLLSNPLIDGALRGRIGDVLSNPSSLIETAVGAFGGDSLTNALAIGDRLTSLLGAQALNGNIGQIVSELDLLSLPMIKELGIPSWVMSGVNDLLMGGDFTTTLFDVVPEMADGAIADILCQVAGELAAGGTKAPGVRSAINGLIEELGEEFDSDFVDRVGAIATRLDRIPLRIPRNSDGEQDDLRTTTQRLGRHILRGNNSLGGAAKLFSLSSYLDESTRSVVAPVARIIEQFAANPHELLDFVPDAIATIIPTLANIPPEIRELISALPAELIPRINGLSSGLFGRSPISSKEDVPGCDEAEESDIPGGATSQWLDAERKLGNLLQSAPNAIQDLVTDLPDEALSAIASLPVNEIKALFQNPAAIIDGLDTGMIRSIFGGGFSAGAGVFDMRVQRRAQFSIQPQGVEGRSPLSTSQFHPVAPAPSIQRTVGYGKVNIKWSADG